MTLALRVLDELPEVPPGWDARALLRPLMHSAATQRGPAGAAYRRHVTRSSPFLFTVLYLSGRLTDAATGRMSLNPLHLELCALARTWASPGRAGRRVAVVGPREGGKSVWCDEALPLWAAAHGHKRFPYLFSYTGKQGVALLSNVRELLRETPHLLADFPELAPARGPGTANRADRLDLAGGATIGAAGLHDTVLGARAGDARPDPIIVDDAEPLEGHSPAKKAALLGRLRREVLPMNSRADVLLAGTTTMYGSIAHDLVRAGRPDQLDDWPIRERFEVLHFPALDVGPDGRERSLWPRRWPLAELARMRTDDPDGFALNYQCDPAKPGGADGVTYWTDELIRLDPRARPDAYVVAVDVAVTRNARSDFTTLAVVGYERARRRAVVVHAEQGRMTLLELQERLWALHQANPALQDGVIETNQGGDLWLDNMTLPPGLSLRPVHESRAKDARIRALHRHYQRGAVVHVAEFPALRRQLLDWPAVEHDDLVDVAARAVDETFKRVA